MSCRITPSAKTILKSHHNQANDTLQNKRYDFWKQGAFFISYICFRYDAAQYLEAHYCHTRSSSVVKVVCLSVVFICGCLFVNVITLIPFEIAS